MAEVLFIKHVPTKKRVQIGVLLEGNECTYSVSEATYAMLGVLTVGSDINESCLGTIRFEDEYYRALKKASTYLSLSDKSKFSLKLKLIRAGFSSETADMALDRLTELGYLDEDRQLQRAVEREANYNLRGPYYIRRKLASKGYSISAINRAIDLLRDRGDVNFADNFEELAKKKCAFTDEERNVLEYKFGYRS